MEDEFRHPPTWRAKCRISGSGKTLKVRTLGCVRRSFPYRSMSQRLAMNLSYTMINTRDTRFMLLRATVVV